MQEMLLKLGDDVVGSAAATSGGASAIVSSKADVLGSAVRPGLLKMQTISNRRGGGKMAHQSKARVFACL